MEDKMEEEEKAKRIWRRGDRKDKKGEEEEKG